MDVVTRLDRLTRNKPLCLFMRGDRRQPTCEQSEAMVRLLRDCDADFHVVNVQQDPEARAFLGKFSDSAEIPQLFVNGEFLGDAQVITELHDQGELKAMIDSTMTHYRLTG